MPQNIDPRQLDSYTIQLIEIYRQLEDNAFQNIARYLKTDPSLTREQALVWQAERLRDLGLLNAQTIAELARVTGIRDQEIVDTFNRIQEDVYFTVDRDVARSAQGASEEVLAANGINAVAVAAASGGIAAVPLASNLDSLLNALVDNMRSDLDNLVNARLINQPGVDGEVTRMAKRIIERATAEAIAGDITVNAAVAKATREFREIGLDSGFVDRSGRRWRVQQYVDTVVRTTANQTYNQLSETRQRQYGIDLVLVDVYESARPACQPIQGRVCSLDNPSRNPKYPTIYDFGYGRPNGIRGIHCRHKLIPFVDGVNTNNLNPPSVEEANQRFKLEQNQRRLEVSIRRAKEDLNVANIFGDEDEINRAKRLIRDRQAVLRNFVSENELPRRRDRERVI